MTIYESKYESRFSYIDDDNLRKHMGDALEFIADILGIADNFPENNKNYFYKTCILYTASIIESHIHYCILKLGYTEYKSKNTIYKYMKLLYKCDSNLSIMSGIQEKEIIKLDGNVDFNILNNFAYKTAKIYNNAMFKKIDKVRKLRNNIHLMKLEDIDRVYSKNKLNEVFEISRELFKIIEKELKKS